MFGQNRQLPKALRHIYLDKQRTVDVFTNCKYFAAVMSSS